LHHRDHLPFWDLRPSAADGLGAQVPAANRGFTAWDGLPGLSPKDRQRFPSLATHNPKTHLSAPYVTR
jgi:hypothetical protein